MLTVALHIWHHKDVMTPAETFGSRHHKPSTENWRLNLWHELIPFFFSFFYAGACSNASPAFFAAFWGRIVAFLSAESLLIELTNSVSLAVLLLAMGWIQWGRLISSEVMCVGVLGGWGFYSLSGSNRPDQPLNLSPVLLDDGPTEELISLGTLGNWEMTLEPASCANKIW